MEIVLDSNLGFENGSTVYRYDLNFYFQPLPTFCTQARSISQQCKNSKDGDSGPNYACVVKHSYIEYMAVLLKFLTLPLPAIIKDARWRGCKYLRFIQVCC
jgi:hypothetical protein